MQGLLDAFASEYAPIGILGFDIDGECVYANAEYRRITGLDRDSASGRGWAEPFRSEDGASILESFIAAGAKRRPFHRVLGMSLADGTSRTVLMRFSPVNDPKFVGYVAAVEDITLRLKMENQLRIHFAAMESITSMIMITDARGSITWVNPAFTQGTGYTFNEVIGRSPRFLSAGTESPVREAIRLISGTGECWQGELMNKRKNGTFYLEEQIISPVIGADGSITHYVAIKNDITEKKDNERKLREYSEGLQKLVEERTRELELAQACILDQRELERDLEIAAQIQRSLLPARAPDLPFLEIASYAFAARYISGDLFDYIPDESGALFVLMADISGHGVPAALLTASARTTVREKILLTKSPAEILDRVNQALFGDLSRTEMFITMLLLRIDPDGATYVYANAGHTLTMHHKASGGSLEYWGPTSVPIGIMENLEATERSGRFESGDLLLLYSDGLTEAEDENGKPLGERAVAAELVQCERESASEVVARIESLVRSHTEKNEMTDDLSMIVIKNIPEQFTVTLEASGAAVERIVSLVGEKTRRFGDLAFHDSELAVTELLTNIVRHAYKRDPSEEIAENTAGAPIEFTFQATRTGIVIDLWDKGEPFDEAAYREPVPGELQEGGYGLFLIRKIFSVVRYRREKNGRNHWHLEKPMGEKS